MNDETAAKPRIHAWPKYLLVALLAIIVVGVGTVLVPKDAGKPAAVPFTESARADALAATESLLGSASLMDGAGTASGTGSNGSGSMTATVSILTTQARALLSPAASPSATASPSAGSGSGSGSSASAGRPTPAAFVSALSASGSRRLADAEKADGGMARLLAAVGTAQLLESTRLAAAWGLPAPALPPVAPATADPTPPASCPSLPDLSATNAPPAPGAPTATAAATSGLESSPADLAHAVSAVVSSEQEAVYAYQVAVTKLDARASETADAWLIRHQTLLQEAEAQGRLHCVATPPREAGYRLPASFAAKPAAALGTMEADSLSAYADLVALSSGQTRQWAIDGLVDTARRSQSWGAAVGPFAGMQIDDGALPPLPAASPTR